MFVRLLLNEDERIERWCSSPHTRPDAGRQQDDAARYEELLASVERNEATEIPLIPLPYAHGFRLGQALQGNTSVTNFRLQVCKWIKNDLVSPEAGAHDDAVTLLLMYLRNSPALRELDLCLRSEFMLAPAPSALSLSTLILRTLAHHPRLTHCSIATVIPPDVLSHFIESTSVTHLSLTLSEWFEGPLYMIHLAVSLTSNQSIQVLTLVHRSTTSVNVELILRSVKDNFNLAELSLSLDRSDARPESHGAMWSALAVFLEHSPSVRSLSLTNYQIRAQDMTVLSAGLHSSRTLQHLTLRECRCNEVATLAFQECLQRPGTVPLQTLSLKSRQPMFESLEPGEIVASILTLPDNLVPTIGSSLRVLRLSPTLLTGFHHSLATRSSRIRLPRLELRYLDAESCRELSLCLPQMVHLRELHLGFRPMGRVDRAGLSRALRRNGSLWNVTAHDHTVFPSLPDEPETYRYQRRNQGMVALRPRSMSSVTPGRNPDEESDEMKRLVPLYFEAVKAAPRTAPNVLHEGLLAFCSSLPTDE